MNIKKIIISFSIFYFVILAFVFFTTFRQTNQPQLDVIEVNHITQTVAQNWANIDNFDISVISDSLDFSVITPNEYFLVATRDGLNVTLNTAITNRDTIVDVIVSDEVVGKIIFYNDSVDLINHNQIRVFAVVAVVLTVFTVIIISYLLYLQRVILHPFKKLELFAKSVAAGNLDLPLEMDKQQIFGAFTESFDLMREELHKARENERIANQSKKELVAQLSHDIKTPIASIKAVSELMYVLADSEKEKTQLTTINAKAEQINGLITEMFHATLEELKALTVDVKEVTSSNLVEILKRVDYQGLLQPFTIPAGLIMVDLLRIEQVFDNIIANAYKYAKTEIAINSYFQTDFLVIEILDFGKGVAAVELPLLMQKFYRAKDVTEEKGYGLGLYTASYLVTEMGGMLEVDNHEGGFVVRVLLRLV